MPDCAIPSADRSRRIAWTTAAVAAIGWLVVFARLGSGLALGMPEVLQQIDRLPHPYRNDADPSRHYINSSVLPPLIDRILFASTARAVAAAQTALGIAGTVAVAAWAGKRWGRRAALGVAAGVATLAWPHTLRFTGGYDNLLVILLLAAVFVDVSPWTVLLGVALGLTHAELAAIVLLQLAALSYLGYGPQWRSRAEALGGVAAGKLAVVVWLRIEGVRGSRLSFISDYGVSRLAHQSAGQWPWLLWSLLGGGWLIVAYQLWRRRSARLVAVVVGALAANVLVVTLTIDQSRVAALLSYPLVVAVAAFVHFDRRLPAVTVAAVAVAMVVPFAAVYVGQRIPVGAPFSVRW